MAEIIRPDAFEERARQLLRHGGDGGDDGAMSGLAKRVETLEALATAIRVDVAEIKGRLSNMPTTFQLVSWFVGVSIALVGLTFTIARLMK